MPVSGPTARLRSLAVLAAAAFACSPGGLIEPLDGGMDGCGDGCPDGSACREGACVDAQAACEAIVCRAGTRCEAGTCVPDTPCDGVVCPNPGEVCQGGECVSGEADEDGDGSRAREDCDDSDPAVHPGATEECNGIDDDCDSDVDEGHDLDGDGHTWCGSGVPPRGDCDDDDPTAYPGATETCDGADDDCDGEVDGLPDRPCGTACGSGTERCLAGAWVCDAPATCECVAGETEEADCGDCGNRSRACGTDLTWGAWSACSGEGICSVGEIDTTACDRCSRRVCGTDCQWGACELSPGSTCEWEEGTHYRCCGADHWQFCLPSCVWSTDCAPCTSCSC